MPQGEGDGGLEEDRDGEGDGREDGGDVQVLLCAQCWLQGERVRTWGLDMLLSYTDI